MGTTDTKEDLVSDVMSLLERPYLKDSGIYQLVKIGIGKLSMNELAGLKMMLLGKPAGFYKVTKKRKKLVY